MQLQGRVAIVTGGAKGIGLGISRVLGREGAAIVLFGRDTEALHRAERELSERRSDVLACPGDVSRALDVQRMVDAASARFGQVDILVNNAGVNLNRGRSVLETTETDWDDVMSVNLRGAFLCTKAVLPLMKAQRRGWIVNIASIAGRLSPDGKNCAYRASKFGLRGFAWTVAKDVRDHDIAVSVVFPGTTRSEMVVTEAGDPTTWLDPTDVGEAVLFLATRPLRVVVPEITVSPRVAIGGLLCPYS